MVFAKALIELNAGKAIRRPQWLPGMIASFINPWAQVQVSPAYVYWEDVNGRRQSDELTLRPDMIEADDWEIVEPIAISCARTGIVV